jgi:hypothetical protein
VSETTVRESACVDVRAEHSESATCRVKLVVPEVPGMPVILPVDEFSAAQEGSEPLATVQVYGEIPPAT